MLAVHYVVNMVRLAVVTGGVEFDARVLIIPFSNPCRDAKYFVRSPPSSPTHHRPRQRTIALTRIYEIILVVNIRLYEGQDSRAVLIISCKSSMKRALSGRVERT